MENPGWPKPICSVNDGKRRVGLYIVGKGNRQTCGLLGYAVNRMVNGGNSHFFKVDATFGQTVWENHRPTDFHWILVSQGTLSQNMI